MSKVDASVEKFNYYPSNLKYYEYIYSDHIKYSNELLSTILPILKQNSVDSVLDACCGVGNDIEFFLKNQFSVYASDLSQRMVDYTKKRVAKFNIPESHFFQGNALDISKIVDRKFDLVCFRGNTLGHLSDVEQIKLIEELLSVTKDDGFLLIDFRNGEKYFLNKPRYEQRGWGFDRIKKRFYFSFYLLSHSLSLSVKYKIKSILFLLDFRKFRVVRVNNQIAAYYVVKESLINALESKKLKFEFIDVNCKGLPLIETILIKNSL
jgi:SAM-dependent methyltransferase